MAVATFCGSPDFVLIHCDFLVIPGGHHGCDSHWLCDRWIQVLVDYATIRVIDTRCMIAHGLLSLKGSCRLSYPCTVQGTLVRASGYCVVVGPHRLLDG